MHRAIVSGVLIQVLHNLDVIILGVLIYCVAPVLSTLEMVSHVA
jgi:hypothetical protein